MRPGLNKEAVMADDPKPDPKKGDDPDAGAKKALEAERKLRREAEADAKAEKAKVADLEKRLGAVEAGDKGGDEKLTEKLAQLEKDLGDERAKRLVAEVAAEKGLTPAQARRLAGLTREELLEDADDILENLPAPKKDAGTDDEPTRRGGPPSRRPAADLKGGSDPTDEPIETDPAKLAASVPRL